jgi:hypothetical protein
MIRENLNTVAQSDQNRTIIKNTSSATNARKAVTTADMFSPSSETNNDRLYTPGM